MRKSLNFTLLLVISTILVGCIGYDEPQFSPSISSSPFFVNPVFEGDSLIGAQDTLDMTYDSEDDIYNFDTVYVGDTVLFATTFYTYNSNLVTVELSWEKDFLNLWYPLADGITKVLRDTSNIENGKLYFNPGYNRVSFPIYFTPKVQGGLNLKLAVESDSEFPISSVSLYIPAKERVVADSTIVE